MTPAEADPTYAPVSLGSVDYRPDGLVPPPEPIHLPSDRHQPARRTYIAFTVLLLTGTAILVIATAGVLGRFVHIAGEAAMLTSALSIVLAVAALFCLRAALGRRHRDP